MVYIHNDSYENLNNSVIYDIFYFKIGHFISSCIAGYSLISSVKIKGTFKLFNS